MHTCSSPAVSLLLRCCAAWRHLCKGGERCGGVRRVGEERWQEEPNLEVQLVICFCHHGLALLLRLRLALVQRHRHWIHLFAEKCNLHTK